MTYIEPSIPSHANSLQGIQLHYLAPGTPPTLSMTLPNKVIVDIIYLAHTQKLTTSDKFAQLVDWVDSDCFSAPVTTPNTSTPVSASDTCAITHVKHCGNCCEVRHNGKSSLSLYHQWHKLIQA